MDKKYQWLFGLSLWHGLISVMFVHLTVMTLFSMFLPPQPKPDWQILLGFLLLYGFVRFWERRYLRPQQAPYQCLVHFGILVVTLINFFGTLSWLFTLLTPGQALAVYFVINVAVIIFFGGLDVFFIRRKPAYAFIQFNSE